MIDELILDPQLKYWVLLPISIVMVIVGLVRSNITSLLGPDVKLEDAKKNREKQFLKRATNFKTGNSVLNQSEFLMRQGYFTTTLKTDEFYATKPNDNDTPVNPLTDPNANEALMNMAKGLKPVYSIIMNDSNAANELVMQQQNQQQLPNLGAPGGPKTDKVFQNEADNIHILTHELIYDGIVDRILEAEGKK